MSRRKPTVISLFTGAGGLDHGFEAAGFRTAVAIERDHQCCETLRANRSWTVIERDIHEVRTEEMLAAGKLRRGEVDVLIGGPPCQPFSKSGYWASGDTLRLDDPRASTLSAYMRVVRDALPRVFLLENVAGLSFSGKNEGLTLLLDAIEEINRSTRSNYRPVYRILRAADYGVPQIRERFFLVAARDGSELVFPEPTHALAEESTGQRRLANLEPYRTAWDAIGDVITDSREDLAMRGKWASLLPTIPEGQNYLWHTERGGGLPLFGWRRRYWSFLLKLAKERPSWTIQAQPGPAIGPFHWMNRRLSARELCRLQTFPDDVTIRGNVSAVQRQVGNAVPSLLAEILARAIRVQLLGHGLPSGRLRLLPPRREPVPEPEPTLPVPREYHRYIGDHAPHPGTGLGYRVTALADSPVS
jgi:DNA (cytosine-5)-methyltransferase 1